MAAHNISIELSAVIVAVSDGRPVVLAMPDMALPSGPFATEHRTLEQGLRSWVSDHSGIDLGYVEQLYTFADRDRVSLSDGAPNRMVSIGYLALTREIEVAAPEKRRAPAWESWYDLLPWEDRRSQGGMRAAALISAALREWCCLAPAAADRRERERRCKATFPADAKRWNEELVLQRYELLWEAGLVRESPCAAPTSEAAGKVLAIGKSMALDHRRILATAMARLRAKIKYRPVVFELMPDKFTLLHLQDTVEALAGLRLHKQNFRRLAQGQGLIEETGGRSETPRGRPARLFAFRKEVVGERAFSGTRLPRREI